MHKLSNVVGKPVVSAESGERIGKVADLLLDADSRHVVGLVVAAGLLGGEHVLPFRDVQTLGRDAVIARSRSGVMSPVEWRREAVQSVRTSTLKHKRVLTTGGRALGEVQDVLLGDTGNVEALEISGSSVGGLLSRRTTVPQAPGVTVGADAVLVPEEAADALRDEPGS